MIQKAILFGTTFDGEYNTNHRRSILGHHGAMAQASVDQTFLLLPKQCFSGVHSRNHIRVRGQLLEAGVDLGGQVSGVTIIRVDQ